MIRIAIILLLIPLMKSEKCLLNGSDISTLENSFNTATDYMKKSAIHGESLICIGTSRAGKSTFINYLIGNKLRSVRFSRFGEFKIIKADNESSGPEIGIGPTSKTKIPTKWTSIKLPNLTIWDTPGFEDNRGIIQEITNSMYFYNLMKNVNLPKFILIINFGDIHHDSNTPLLRDLNILEQFFGDKFKHFFSRITVIFSKVPFKLYNNEVNITVIQRMLNAKVVIIREILSNVLKKFVDFLLRCRDRIAIFRLANTTSNIGYEFGLNIFQSIINSENVQGNSVQNVGQSISDTTKYCFLQYINGHTSFQKLYELWTSLQIKLVEKITIFINLTKNGDKNTTETMIKNLTNIYVLLNSSRIDENDIFKNLELLQTVEVNLMEKIEESDTIKKIEFNIFASNLLTLNENEEFNLIMKMIIMSMREKIKASISEISNFQSLIQEKKKIMEYSKKLEKDNNTWHIILYWLKDLFDDSNKPSMG
ncbi:uncharacterized protein LOC122505769 [Leptopilina heterotoma]|uniref:uncharacterized protein LOC122505769 n=1 Tax=Leptopilina heterotoma TaxID=63436 RepID=UPI001CA8C3B2|nr:uncharacterized protein LOC122505769 [Leptopilina heterotoma]